MKRKLEILALLLTIASVMVFIGSPAPCAEIDVTTGLPPSGEVSPGAVEALKPSALGGGNVLWDTYHGIYLGYSPSGRYSTLASVLSAKGYSIDENSSGILNLTLNNYDIIVICVASAWLSAYSSAEVSALQDYVAAGGGLLIMGDNTDCPNANINPVAQAFGTTLGVSFIAPLDLYVTDMTTHPIFRGVSQIYMRAVGEISGTSPSSEQAWADTGEAVVTVAEVSGGRVVALGDFNIFDNTYIGNVSNQLFAENIFDWLRSDYCFQDSYGFTWLLVEIEEAAGYHFMRGVVDVGSEVRNAVATYDRDRQTLSMSADKGTGVPFNYHADMRMFVGETETGPVPPPSAESANSSSAEPYGGSGVWMNITASSTGGFVTIWRCGESPPVLEQPTNEGPLPGFTEENSFTAEEMSFKEKVREKTREWRR